MVPTNEILPSKPAADEIATLKRLTTGIIRSQGNRFIKELLRRKNIQIGENKNDFVKHLTKAIEKGQLKLADIGEWLREVEGWGDQHVYVYRLLPQVCKDLNETSIYQAVKRARLERVWDKESVMAFPDEATLTSISFKDSMLRLVWQEASPGWIPTPEKNLPPKKEGLDIYEYRAWRKIEQRIVTRFEAHAHKKLAALFISRSIRGKELEAAIQEGRRVIGLLLNLAALERGQINICAVSKNFDQQAIPTGAAGPPDVKVQKSRLTSGGSYVEFAADSLDKAYWEEPAIMEVRKSVRTSQLGAFQGTDGVFILQGKAGTRGSPRALRVQLSGKENRIRLWAQMDSAEVWDIITRLCQYQ